jgi:glycosyltransferase involved in cell wall biosynthesis
MTGEPYCISTWLALILNRVLGKKTYLWTHGWYGDETRVKKYIKKIFFKLSDHILLYGNYAKNIMIQEGFIESKLSVIYNSLDYDQQIAIRKKLAKSSVYLEHFKNNYPNLIYIGRIQPVKRLDLLVIAVKRLESIGVKCNLIIVGEPLKNYSIVEHILNNDLMDRVWLYGPCYDEEKIGELIYNADICVSPGNVGLTAIHSLMYGTPIITHNNFCSQMPEFEAISEGVTGGFFIENDVYDLCCKISHWLKYLESNKGKTQSEAYRIIDTKYNPHYQIRLLESIIKN